MKTLLLLAVVWVGVLAEPSLHGDLASILQTMGDPQKLFRAALEPKINISYMCSLDIHKYMTSIKEIADAPPWALRMLDASTKVPEGILTGNLVQLGNYDECLNVTGVQDVNWNFDGQHCLATITLGQNSEALSEVDQALLNVQQMARSSISGNLGNITGVLEGLTMQIALCIPSTCSPQDLQMLLQLALKENNLTSSVTTSVNPDQCHTAKVKPSLRFVDWFAIGFLAFFVFLAAASTLYDVRCRRNEVKGKPTLLSFSLYTNWLRLISINSSAETMTAVNGIRFISMGWVVLGHRYLVISGLPAVNMIYLENFKKDWTRLTIMNGTLSVDTFFLLSGLLTSYVFLREMEKRGRFNILLFYVHRYLRLTPALAVMVLMTATLFNYGGEGPLWDSRNRKYREACEKNWWTTLLYVNNYVDPATLCLGQTWYLSVDMQLHWLSPLVLIPLWKAPRASQVLIVVLLLVGWGSAFAVPYIETYWAGVWTGPVELRAIAQQNNYYPTHTRFMPWLIGIALGYWMRQAKKTKLKLTSSQVILGWIMSTVLMLGSMHLAYPFQQPEYQYNRLETAFYVSLFRPMWTLGVAWIIFASDLGYGGLPNKILSWSIFQPLGRLSYGIYLTHVSVLILLTSSIKTPLYLADVTTIPLFMGDLLISLGLAIALVLLFESPIILLEKQLLGPKDNRRKEMPAVAQPAAPNPAKEGV